MEQLQQALQAAQSELDPQFKTLRGIISALKTATRLANDEKADAIPMHKALMKLEAAAAGISNPTLDTAVATFAAATQTALDNLAYDFARDLREAFLARGETVDGRPPLLGIGPFTFKIDIAARKGQWFYGREPLTGMIPLSLKGIMQHYDRQMKRINERDLDAEAFLQELFKAWQTRANKRSRAPVGGRINIIELYAEFTMGRQNARFWNAPSRSTFKDYERELFVRDLVLLRQSGLTSLTVDDKTWEIRLGVATKSQAEQASRSMWLPAVGFDGEYYSDIIFESM
ncbi:MAG: hypothetical protein KC418_03615 [Anaerolineales bacterium]|nr:hypothetical protein [Anaerolineales bacterium]MCB8953268.1 hypothetical protein [Ardenticatenales bacterium]